MFGFLSSVIGFINFVIVITCIILFIRYREDTFNHFKIGAIYAIFVILLDLSTLLFHPENSTKPINIIVINTILFLKLSIMYAAGKYCLQNLKSENKIPKSSFSSYYNCFFYSLFTSIIFIAYSAALFAITKPSINEVFSSQAGGSFIKIPISDILVLLQFSISEEIIFRLGVLTLLLRFFKINYKVSIIVGSLLWSFSHIGILEPYWVKIVQIFPFGIALGYLFYKKGLLASIVAHAMFNTVGSFLLVGLVR